MIHPGLPLAKICILVVVAITMLIAATNKVAVDSITTISSSTQSATPHTLGPHTSTRTFATTLNSSGADEIMIHEDTNPNPKVRKSGAVGKAVLAQDHGFDGTKSCFF